MALIGSAIVYGAIKAENGRPAPRRGAGIEGADLALHKISATAERETSPVRGPRAGRRARADRAYSVPCPAIEKAGAFAAPALLCSECPAISRCWRSQAGEAGW